MTVYRCEVVVMGDALLDVAVRPAAPIRPGADVPAEIRIGCGGQGANLAIRLARRGIGVELVCALGDDPGGMLLRDALVRDGVGLSAVATAATGTVVILLDQRGERTMLSHRASFAATAAAALRDDVGWLVVSGYLLLEPDADELARALAGARVHIAVVGCTVPNQMVDRWARAAAAMRPELVILNREEADNLLPGASTADDLLLRLGERLGSGVVVTDPAGATARVHGVIVAVRAPSAAPAIDSTGAGDAFAAALVAALLRSPFPPATTDLEAALTAAAELASAVAHADGAQAHVAGEHAATLQP